MAVASDQLHFVESVDEVRGGGLAVSVLGLHDAMLRLGENSRVVTLDRTDGFGTAHPEDRGDRKVLELGGWGRRAGFFSPHLLSMARPLVRDAEIVHGHGFFTFANLVIPAMARRLDVPIVLHPHGMLEPWALSRSRMKKKAALLVFESRNVRSAAMWRALTTREADQVMAMGVEAPVVVVPNGVCAADAVPRSATAMERDYRVLLYLGRLHPKKGLDILVRAWSRLGPRRSDWQLHIVGPDDDSYRSSLEGLVAEEGLESCVRFFEAERGRAKWQRLADADAFVLVSRSEGYPVSVLEAMASRLPVLVSTESNVVGVESRGAGRECSSNVESVSRALESLLSLSGSELAELGLTARRWVESRFDWSVIGSELVSATASIR